MEITVTWLSKVKGKSCVSKFGFSYVPFNAECNHVLYHFLLLICPYNFLTIYLPFDLPGDASHMTSPSEDGIGAELCMKSALCDAKLSPKDVTYINAHATSTPTGQ